MLNFMLSSMFKMSSMGNWWDRIWNSILNLPYAMLIYYFIFPLYNIVSTLALICDILQSVYLQIIGLGQNSSGWGWAGDASGDILTDFLYNSSIQIVFRNFILIALVLLLVLTVFAILKSEYAQENTTKMQIVGRSVKALFTFFLVPALTFGGIYLSNQLLKTLYLAASPTEAETVSQTLFILSMSSANKAGAQINADGIINYNNIEFYNVISSENVNSINGGYFGTSNAKKASNLTGGDIAAQVDYAMIHGIPAGQWQKKDDDYMSKFCPWSLFTGYSALDRTHINYYNPAAVFTYYEAIQVNWLLLIGGLTFIVFFMAKLTLGLIARIFNIVFLYVISPGVVGLMPLDNGAAFKNWRQQMVKQVLSAYGALIGMTLFGVICSVVPSLKFNITIFGGTISGFLVSGIIQFFFIIVALQLATKFPGIIAGFIGGGDAYQEGSGMAKQVANTAGKVVKTGATIAAGVMTGGATMAAKGLGGAGKAMQFMKQRQGAKNTFKQSKQTLKDIKKNEDGSYSLREGYSGAFDGLSQEQLAETYNNATNNVNEFKKNYGGKVIGKGLLKGTGGALKTMGLGIVDSWGGVLRATKNVAGEQYEGSGVQTIVKSTVDSAKGMKERMTHGPRQILQERKATKEATQAYTDSQNAALQDIIDKFKNKDIIIQSNQATIDANKTKLEGLGYKGESISDLKNQRAEATESGDTAKVKDIDSMLELLDNNNNLERENSYVSGLTEQDVLSSAMGINANNKMNKEVQKNRNPEKLSESAKKYVDDAAGYAKSEEESNNLFENVIKGMGFDDASLKKLQEAMKSAFREAYSKGDPESAGQIFKKALKGTALEAKIGKEQIDNIVNKFNEANTIEKGTQDIIKKLVDSNKNVLDEIKKLVEKKDGDDKGGKKK